MRWRSVKVFMGPLAGRFGPRCTVAKGLGRDKTKLTDRPISSPPMRIGALITILLMSLSAFAQQDESIVADRPGLADGAATVGDAVFQVETGLNIDSAGDEAVTLPTLLRYGFGDRF